MRFLDLVAESRHDAQLLIVSHQKKTMEAADELYGVTMAPGGSSRAIKQRIEKPTGDSSIRSLDKVDVEAIVDLVAIEEAEAAHDSADGSRDAALESSI